MLGQLDATNMLNGLYTVTLQATDSNGETTAQSITVLIDGNLKVGNFSFTVVDLEVPLTGLPIRVTRTYDSRRRHEALDYGYGWSVGYQDVRVEESQEPSVAWTQTQEYQTYVIEDQATNLQGFCIRSPKEKNVGSVGGQVLTYSIKS